MSWQVVKGPRRLEAGTAPEVTETCLELLDSQPFLILDLSETVFLASAGLAALAQLDRVAKENGGELRVSGCSGDVRRVLELVRFDRVLNLYHDLASALAQEPSGVALASAKT